MQTYLAGSFDFQFTGTVGDKSLTFIRTIVFIDPCLTASVSLQTSPFSDYEYILRADAKTFEWEYADILTIDTQVDCGAISVDFFNSEDESALDLNLFSDVRSDTNNFSIGPSQDVSKDEIRKVAREKVSARAKA